MTNNDIRDVAIIAHGDHGKTTLVDQMLRQNSPFNGSPSPGTCVVRKACDAIVLLGTYAESA